MGYSVHALHSTPFSGPVEVAAAKPGFRVVVTGFGIKTGGKFTSDGSDLTDTLPDGYVMADQPDFLFKGADDASVVVTAGTGFVTWGYERVGVVQG